MSDYSASFSATFDLFNASLQSTIINFFKKKNKNTDPKLF